MDSYTKEKDFQNHKQKEYDTQTYNIANQDGVWYKAKTKKGDSVHILVVKVMTLQKGQTLRYPELVGQKVVYYLQGDKVKLDRFDVFYRGVESGDIEPLRRDQVDMERLSEGAIVLEAISRGVDVTDLMEMKASGKDEIQNNARLQKLGLF